jgi:uncharacterized membrane protein
MTETVPRAPGLLLGIGLGGFVDGIVLHQILQWHHMLTGTGDQPMTTVAGLETNTLVDGLFHAATWLFVAIGSWLMFRAWQDGRLAPSWRAQLGGPLGWDLASLALGVALCVAGWLLSRTHAPRAAIRPAPVGDR